MSELVRPKNVLITGAASGIGLETARLFAADPNYRVIATDKNSLIHSQFPERRSSHIITSELDVRDPLQITEVVRFVMGEYGLIDVLINNAGVMFSLDKSLMIRPDGNLAPEVREMFEVNVRGPQLLMDQVVNAVQPNQERVVINVNSCAMHNRTRVRTAYALSKSFLAELTHDYAERFNDRDIRFVTVKPGNFKTNIDKGELGWAEGSDKLDKAIVQRIYTIWRTLFGGDPKNVAKVIYLIAEKKEQYPNDTTVFVGWDSHLTSFMDKHVPLDAWNPFFEWAFDHGVIHLATQALLGLTTIKIFLYLSGK